MLGAGDLVEGEKGAGVAQRLADEVAAGGRHVRVEGAEDGEQLRVAEVAARDAGQRVLRGVGGSAQRVRVDVGAEERDGGGHARVERGAQRNVAAQAHARRAEPPGARRQARQVVERQRAVLVVRRERLGRLVLVAQVRAGPVVRKRGGACESGVSTAGSTAIEGGKGKTLPSKLWYTEGAATMKPWPAICLAKRSTGPEYYVSSVMIFFLFFILVHGRVAVREGDPPQCVWQHVPVT